MFKTIKHYLKVFMLFRRLHLMRTLAFRRNFYFWAVVSSFWGLINFFFFGLVAGVGNGIGTWSPDQVLLLISVSNIVDSIVWSFFYHNMEEYTRAIFDGSLNLSLLKPIDHQFLVMTQNNNYTNLPRLIMGVAGIVYFSHRLSLVWTPLQVVSFLLLLLAALIAIYSFWFILSTLAFYVDKLKNINEIIPNAKRLSTMPHQIYRGVFEVLFTVLTPLGIIASVPTQTLWGEFNSYSLRLIALALIFLFLSRRFFYFSLKKYSGIGN